MFYRKYRGMLFWADTVFFAAGRAECFLLHFSFSPPYALKNAPSVTLRANMSPWYHLNSDFSALRPAIQPLPYNGRNPFLPNAENTAVQENQKMNLRLSGFRTCKAFPLKRNAPGCLPCRRVKTSTMNRPPNALCARAAVPVFSLSRIRTCTTSDQCIFAFYEDIIAGNVESVKKFYGTGKVREAFTSAGSLSEKNIDKYAVLLPGSNSKNKSKSK